MSLVNTDRKSNQRSLVLTQGAGKGFPNAQRKRGSPRAFSFFFFFSFSSFSCTPGTKQSLALAVVSSMGVARSLFSEGGEPSFKIGGAMVSREWSKFHCFSSPSDLLVISPDFWHSPGKYTTEVSPPLCWKAEKGEPQGTRRLQGNHLKLIMDCRVDFQVVLVWAWF